MMSKRRTGAAVVIDPEHAGIGTITAITELLTIPD